MSTLVELSCVLTLIDQMLAEKKPDNYGHYLPSDQWHTGTLLRIKARVQEVAAHENTLLSAAEESGLTIDECVAQIRAAAGIKKGMAEMKQERMRREGVR